MKNKFSNGKLSYFFTPRLHGNVLAWVKPASKAERSKRVIENILRWEDDGGKIIETNHLLLDPPFVQPVPINGGMHDTSLQWNEKFVIEPISRRRLNRIDKEKGSKQLPGPVAKHTDRD
jgi:hypothetical protein